MLGLEKGGQLEALAAGIPVERGPCGPEDCLLWSPWGCTR